MLVNRKKCVNKDIHCHWNLIQKKKIQCVLLLMSSSDITLSDMLIIIIWIYATFVTW